MPPGIINMGVRCTSTAGTSVRTAVILALQRFEGVTLPCVRNHGTTTDLVSNGYARSFTLSGSAFGNTWRRLGRGDVMGITYRQRLC